MPARGLSPKFPAPMLFLTFQLGAERYALEASCVVEVVPLVTFRRVPEALRGVAGLFNYRGSIIPAVDLGELTLGCPAVERLSTRIVIVKYAFDHGREQLLGLVAEHATGTLRTDARRFFEGEFSLKAAPYLGPVVLDEKGSVQLLRTEHLLSQPMRAFLFSQPAALHDAPN
jgi:chemotaxis-related protein WspB